MSHEAIYTWLYALPRGELAELASRQARLRSAVAERLGEDPSRAFHALEHLVDAGLAESARPSRYHIARLRHAYAGELAAGARLRPADRGARHGVPQ